MIIIIIIEANKKVCNKNNNNNNKQRIYSRIVGDDSWLLNKRNANEKKERNQKNENKYGKCRWKSVQIVMIK